jgi:hypothetical protein
MIGLGHAVQALVLRYGTVRVVCTGTRVCCVCDAWIRRVDQEMSDLLACKLAMTGDLLPSPLLSSPLHRSPPCATPRQTHDSSTQRPSLFFLLLLLLPLLTPTLQLIKFTQNPCKMRLPNTKSANALSLLATRESPLSSTSVSPVFDARFDAAAEEEEEDAGALSTVCKRNDAVRTN